MSSFNPFGALSDSISVRSLLESDFVIFGLTSISDQRVLLDSSLGEKRVVSLKAGQINHIKMFGASKRNWSVTITALQKCESPKSLAQGDDPRVLCFGLARAKTKYSVSFISERELRNPKSAFNIFKSEWTQWKK